MLSGDEKVLILRLADAYEFCITQATRVLGKKTPRQHILQLGMVFYQNYLNDKNFTAQEEANKSIMRESVEVQMKARRAQEGQ